MIIIGPFIFIVNNYGVGSTEDQSPDQSQPPPARSLTERSRPTKKETEGLIHVKCDKPGCDFEGWYDTPGKCKQALGGHSWKCPLIKRPFGRSKQPG